MENMRIAKGAFMTMHVNASVLCVQYTSHRQNNKTTPLFNVSIRNAFLACMERKIKAKTSVFILKP